MTNCKVIEGTMGKDRALAACGAIEKEARFKPALSAGGEPVAAPFILPAFAFTTMTTIYIDIR